MRQTPLGPLQSNLCRSDNYLLFFPSLIFGSHILGTTWPAATGIFLEGRKRTLGTRLPSLVQWRQRYLQYSFLRTAETRFYKPARLSTPNKPLFSQNRWFRSLLSKAFQLFFADLALSRLQFHQGGRLVWATCMTSQLKSSVTQFFSFVWELIYFVEILLLTFSLKLQHALYSWQG